MGLLSCPTVSSHRPSRLKASFITASLCAGILCSLCPDAASQISTVPLPPPVDWASHLPSGLTAIASEEAQRMCDSPSPTNCHDQTLPIFCGADFASLKANQNAGNPFSCAKLPASFHVCVFQIFSVFPGNRSPGLAASHLPSALNTARFTGVSVRVTISFPCAASQTRNSPEVAARSLPSGLNVTFCTGLWPYKVTFSFILAK